MLPRAFFLGLLIKNRFDTLIDRYWILRSVKKIIHKLSVCFPVLLLVIFHAGSTSQSFYYFQRASGAILGA